MTNEEYIKSCVKKAECVSQGFYLTASSLFYGGRCGMHLGKNAGSSLEFIDHREYHPKDDIRHIDWRVAARGQKPVIKLFKEEIAPHLNVFIDGSASMAADPQKEAALPALAAMLQIAAKNAGYSVAFWLIQDYCRKIEPPFVSPVCWQNVSLTGAANAAETFIKFCPRLKSGGMRIFISDLFYNFEPSRFLSQFSADAALTCVVQLVSKDDISPDLSQNLCLIDSETGEQLELPAASELAAEYQKNFYERQTYLKNCCAASGVFFYMCEAEAYLTNYLPAELIKSGFLSVRG